MALIYQARKITIKKKILSLPLQLIRFSKAYVSSAADAWHRGPVASHTKNDGWFLCLLVKVSHIIQRESKNTINESLIVF